jgi:hypothetical protein
VGEDHSVDEWQVAQAVEFVRALRLQLRKMTGQLASLERSEATGRHARACAMRAETAELRQDIHEAQLLVERLERLYLGRRTVDIPSRPPTRPRAAPPYAPGKPRSVS